MPLVKPVKIQKPHPPADYSIDVRKKLEASHRTGQACDRCRVRKMKCDAAPNGCAPCMQNQSQCATTDRITGKATVRGYVQTLERRVRKLEYRNNQMSHHLRNAGIHFTPSDSDETDHTAASLLEWNEAQETQNKRVWQSQQHAQSPESQGVSHHTPNHHSSSEFNPNIAPLHLPDYRGNLTGNSYLGVSSGNSFLSSIRGTSLNVFGMQIDLADYMSADLDEPDPASFLTQPVYNKSYHAFVYSAFSANPKMAKMKLPPREEGIVYAEWYFRVINPYLPILHKPTFFTLLVAMYDDSNFVPTAAEMAIVHMVFAVMFFQYAARNWENIDQQSELNNNSNLHYHYALGFFAQLVANLNLQKVQALTIICLHLRSFPKPGACWKMTAITLNMAIDLGLHRSAREWVSPSSVNNPLEIEMRKRVFWSILTVHISVSGKLGRPMPLRPDDFDVEIPEALDDELINENGIDTSRPGKCAFLVSIEEFKSMYILMDLYNIIYAVKRTSPEVYVNTVRQLDHRIQQWYDQSPPQLRPESADEENRVHAQYMITWLLEFQLLLHHPSLSLTDSPEFNHENLTVCMEVSRKLLYHVKIIQKYRSLDTNWQTGAFYVLAISTTLFGHWERKDEITTPRLAALKDEMESWLSILGDVGALLGSGKRLQQTVQVIVEGTLKRLARHLASMSRSSVVSAHGGGHGTLPHSTLPPRQAPDHEGFHANQWVDNRGPSGASKGIAAIPAEISAHNHHVLGPKAIPSHIENPYSTSTSNSYPEPSATRLAAYHHNSPSESTGYPAPANNNHPAYAPQTPYPPVGTEPHDMPRTTPTDFLFSSAATIPSLTGSSYQPGPAMYLSSPGSGSASGPSSWQYWTNNLASNLEPEEYMSSANALMQLGGHGDQSANTNASTSLPAVSDAILGGSTATDIATTQQRWPLIIFGNEQDAAGNLTPHAP